MNTLSVLTSITNIPDGAIAILAGIGFLVVIIALRFVMKIMRYILMAVTLGLGIYAYLAVKNGGVHGAAPVRFTDPLPILDQGERAYERAEPPKTNTGRARSGIEEDQNIAEDSTRTYEERRRAMIDFHRHLEEMHQSLPAGPGFRREEYEMRKARFEELQAQLR